MRLGLAGEALLHEVHRDEAADERGAGLYLPASLVAGALWLLHPAAAFLLAAALALVALAVFLRLRPDRDLRLVSGR